MSGTYAGKTNSRGLLEFLGLLKSLCLCVFSPSDHSDVMASGSWISYVGSQGSIAYLERNCVSFYDLASEVTALLLPYTAGRATKAPVGTTGGDINCS